MSDDGFDLTPDASDDEQFVSEDAFDWGEVDAVPEEEEPDILRFGLGGHHFAFEAVHVAEVTTAPQVTPVPGLPRHILGVAVHRRHVLSIVDLVEFLGIERSTVPGGGTERMLILEIDDLLAAAIVEEVEGLELWPEDPDQESESLLQSASPRVRDLAISARWAPGGVVVLLDAPRLIREAAVR